MCSMPVRWAFAGALTDVVDRWEEKKRAGERGDCENGLSAVSILGCRDSGECGAWPSPPPWCLEGELYREPDFVRSQELVRPPAPGIHRGRIAVSSPST